VHVSGTCTSTEMTLFDRERWKLPGYRAKRSRLETALNQQYDIETLVSTLKR
jgi:hypothetical protein